MFFRPNKPYATYGSDPSSLISKHHTPSPGSFLTSFSMEYSADGRISALISYPGSNDGLYSGLTPMTYPAGQWHHVALVFQRDFPPGQNTISLFVGHQLAVGTQRPVSGAGDPGNPAHPVDRRRRTTRRQRRTAQVRRDKPLGDPAPLFPHSPPAVIPEPVATGTEKKRAGTACHHGDRPFLAGPDGHASSSRGFTGPGVFDELTAVAGFATRPQRTSSLCISTPRRPAGSNSLRGSRGTVPCTHACSKI